MDSYKTLQIYVHDVVEIGENKTPRFYVMYNFVEETWVPMRFETWTPTFARGPSYTLINGTLMAAF